MPNTVDIVLYNDCNCEIGRVTVGKDENIAIATVRAVCEWRELSAGDTVKVEQAWHEEA